MVTKKARGVDIHLSDVEAQPELIIDSVIRQVRLGKFTEDDIVSPICHAIAGLAGREISPNQDPELVARKILEGQDAMRNGQQIAACLLRLLPEDGMQWLHEPPWRPSVVTLLDRLPAKDFYEPCGIKADKLAHEKIPAYISAVTKFDQEFEQALQSLSSLDGVSNHRHRVMKVLNGKLGALLARPFLPTDIETRLTELFTRVFTYVERQDGLDVLDAYDKVLVEIDHFLQVMEDRNSIYSMWFYSGVGKTLEELVKEDFENNKAAQPATLSIRPLDKRYPFHLVGQKLEIAFELTNEGPGFAHETRLEIVSDRDLQIIEGNIYVGRIEPGVTRLVEFQAKIKNSVQNAQFLLDVRWQDFNRREVNKEFEFALQAQRSDIPWDQLERQDPYSLEPVTNERDLVGRRDVLNRLIATATASQTGSSFIHGQKRVGKTSIARALQSHLQDAGIFVVYLEGGDYIEPSAKATVSRLGSSLARAISRLDERLAHAPIPEFEEAISPLADYVDDQFRRLLPDKRLVIILDEFDELPVDLYAQGAFGNSFFLSLRSLSSRQFLGFVLVGGEKMRYILDRQGTQLNKWNIISVDYFSRETDWSDYRELVQRPASGMLDYTEDSLVALHEVTAGNPYFTKLVCQSVFRTAVGKNDCYITRAEINAAARTTVQEARINTFQHFWEDGLLGLGDKGKDKSIRRRKVLIAVSDVLMGEKPAPKARIRESKLVRDVPSLESELSEFVSRHVLLEKASTDGRGENSYEIKVPLFADWLWANGISDIIAEFSDLDAAFSERQEEETLRIKPAEIVKLMDRLGPYKGQTITDDRVRAWLEQFKTNKEQRAMFTILSNLSYFSDAYVREKLQEIYEIVNRSVKRELRLNKLKRSDILVSYMDKSGKSGARLARVFADEAKIIVNNLVEKGELAKALEKKDIRALVFVDDIVCTGTSAISYLQELNASVAETVNRLGIKVMFVAVVAYKEGWEKIQALAEELDMQVDCRCCELLDETDKCFSSRSKIFPEINDREFAKGVAMHYGRELEKKWPLGYGDLELAVVFEGSIPNNSLPILWAESSLWTPLFRRH